MGVFRTVTLPLSRPGLAAATLMTAIYVLEDFGNPALIGGQFTVLPTQAYGLISGFGDLAGAAAVSTMLTVLALLLYIGRLRLEGSRSYVTIAGRASAMPRPPVPRQVTWACFSVCLLLALVLLLVYGVLLVSALVQAFPANFAFTLGILITSEPRRCHCAIPWSMAARRRSSVGSLPCCSAIWYSAVSGQAAASSMSWRSCLLPFRVSSSA